MLTFEKSGDGESVNRSKRSYPPAVITDIKLVDPGHVQVTATCPVGGNYTVLTSTSLNLSLNVWGIYSGVGGAVTRRGPHNLQFTVPVDSTVLGAVQRYFALARRDYPGFFGFVLRAASGALSRSAGQGDDLPPWAACTHR